MAVRTNLVAVHSSNFLADISKREVSVLVQALGSELAVEQRYALVCEAGRSPASFSDTLAGRGCEMNPLPLSTLIIFG